MDLRTYDLASGLLDELTAALSHTRAGAPAVAVVHPGNLVPMYGCNGGAAAVRVVTITATPLREGAIACGVDWSVTYEMSVDRCYATPDDNGMPALGVLDSAARDELEDAGAMRKAAVCGWPAGTRAIPGVWTPRGPEGGIHGGAMQVTVSGLTLTCKCDIDVWGHGIDSRIPMLPGDPRG